MHAHFPFKAGMIIYVTNLLRCFVTQPGVHHPSSRCWQAMQQRLVTTQVLCTNSVPCFLQTQVLPYKEVKKEDRWNRWTKD